VEVQYDIQDINATVKTSALSLTNTTGDTYEINTYIDTSGAAYPTLIKYGYYAKDGNGYWTALVENQYFTYTAACP